MMTGQQPAVPGVFLDHLDASIAQAAQIQSAAEDILVRAALLAIAQLARHGDPNRTSVTFYVHECDDPEECGSRHLIPTGWITEYEADDAQAVEDAICTYAGLLDRTNDHLWGPYFREVTSPVRADRYVLDIAKALTIEQPSSELGYKRGEVKYGAGQTPSRPGHPSPTRYFPIDFTER